MSQSPQQLAFNSCQLHHWLTPPRRGYLPPHFQSTLSSPTTPPSRRYINSWCQTWRQSRATLAEVRTATSGSFFRPSNTLASQTPPLSACLTRELRQPSHHGRRPGSRSAFSEDIMKRGASTMISGWSTPPWRTSSSTPSTNPTYPCWKRSTQGMPRRRRWRSSSTYTPIMPASPS